MPTSSRSSIARWATCALIMSVALNALAKDKPDKPDKAPPERPSRSLATCAAFDQADKGDDGQTFTIRNGCAMAIDCTIAWKVVCAPDSKKRRAVHAESVKIPSLADGAQQTTEATTTVCGADSWAIEQVEWTCQPNKD